MGFSNLGKDAISFPIKAPFFLLVAISTTLVCIIELNQGKKPEKFRMIHEARNVALMSFREVQSSTKAA